MAMVDMGLLLGMIWAEFEKVVIILTVTAILALAINRARKLMEYTVIGYAVNLAAKLEKHTKL
jgi:class 3 adenylate cyclase